MRTQEQRKQWRECKARCRQKNPELYKKISLRYEDKVRDERYKKNRERYREHYKHDAVFQAKTKEYRQRNKKKIYARVQAWRKRNMEKWNAYQKASRNRSPSRVMSCRISGRIREALRRRSKAAPTIQLLGCSWKDFAIYLESKFEVGMTWENYGSVWHVDHIMPCAIFDLTKPEHQRRCFHFSNLQPLFGRENLRKGAKITTNQYNLL